MRLIRLESPIDFGGWRRAARSLIAGGVPPENVEWTVGAFPSLLGGDDEEDGPPSPPPQFTVPKAFLSLAAGAILHSDPARFALLYRLLWRLRSEPRLMSVASDADLVRARAMTDAVAREIHKTHAFVRFRAVKAEVGEVYIAWFEPEHHTLEAAAPFFVRRFATMRWSILTPRVSAHWDRETLSFGPGAARSEAPDRDGLEALWRTYYASIFNPARLKTHSMQQHMPRKYWRNMPESALISELVAGASRTTGGMIAQAPSTPRLRTPLPPPRPAIGRVEQSATRQPTDLGPPDLAREQAHHCTACPLYATATQTVFGEGPADASVMFVGEQPGDQEDLAGRPFVGPAGQLFDRALGEASIERSATYVTNAVKHFKFEPRGKRRLHKTPGQVEIEACRQWLEREITALQPRLIVALGATAAHSVLGKPIPVQRSRGKLIRVSDETQVLVTVHPSYLLRVPEEQQAAEYARFVEDLRLVQQFVVRPSTSQRYAQGERELR
jgi:DNA polymerase